MADNIAHDKGDIGMGDRLAKSIGTIPLLLFCGLISSAANSQHTVPAHSNTKVHRSNNHRNRREAYSRLAATTTPAFGTPVRQAPPFRDVPDKDTSQALNDLLNKGILKGYPDGTFKPKRLITRYEFAIALSRALNAIPAGPMGPRGEIGPAGPQGEPGPAGPQGEP